MNENDAVPIAAETSLSPDPDCKAGSTDQTSIEGNSNGLKTNYDLPKPAGTRWDLKRPKRTEIGDSLNSIPTTSSSFSLSRDRNETSMSTPVLSNYGSKPPETLRVNASWNHQRKSSSDPTFQSNNLVFHANNATFSIIQRSDKSKVRQTLTNIRNASQSYLVCPTTDLAHIAFENLSSIVHYSQDDYYRIVITQLEGISIIVEAMKVFIDFVHVQAHASTALIFLCQKSEVNQLALITHTQGLHNLADVLERHVLEPFLTNLCLELMNAAKSLNFLGKQELKQKSMSNGVIFEEFLRQFPETLLLPEAKVNVQTILSIFSTENSMNDKTVK